MDQRICSLHVSEPYLRAIIDASSVTNQQCDYCNRYYPTISAGKLAELMNTVLDRFFIPTTGGDDEGDSEPEGESLLDILERVAGITGDEAELVVELLGEMWFDRDSMDHQYGEDPHFVEAVKFDEPLSKEWQDMEKSLKYEARFNNPKVQGVLEKVFGPIVGDTVGGKEGVVVEIVAGDPLGNFYRARPFNSIDQIERDLAFPERTLGPPPAGVGRAGRMNAKGVPVFYGALDPQVAIAEVRPPVGSVVVVARFEVARPLRLLDIEKLLVIDESGSFFDSSTYDRFMRRDFLKKLVRKLTQPVMPEHEDESYLITQSIADFLATHPELNLDGILFPSAQLDAEMRKSVDGRNVVLFNKSSDVSSPHESASPFAGQATHFQLWDYDEDRMIMDPVLTTEEIKPQLRMPKEYAWGGKKVGPALTLDRDSIEIHNIEGVRYTTKDKKVRHVQKKLST